MRAYDASYDVPDAAARTYFDGPESQVVEMYAIGAVGGEGFEEYEAEHGEGVEAGGAGDCLEYTEAEREIEWSRWAGQNVATEGIVDFQTLPSVSGDAAAAAAHTTAPTTTDDVDTHNAVPDAMVAKDVPASTDILASRTMILSMRPKSAIAAAQAAYKPTRPRSGTGQNRTTHSSHVGTHFRVGITITAPAARAANSDAPLEVSTPAALAAGPVDAGIDTAPTDPVIPIIRLPTLVNNALPRGKKLSTSSHTDPYLVDLCPHPMDMHPHSVRWRQRRQGSRGGWGNPAVDAVDAPWKGFGMGSVSTGNNGWSYAPRHASVGNASYRGSEADRRMAQRAGVVFNESIGSYRTAPGVGLDVGVSRGQADNASEIFGGGSVTNSLLALAAPSLHPIAPIAALERIIPVGQRRE